MEDPKTQDVGLIVDVVDAARRAGVRRLVLPGEAGARLVEARLLSRIDAAAPIPGLTRAPGGVRDVGQYMGVRIAVEPESATVDVWKVYSALILAYRDCEVPSYESVRAMLERSGA